jgi:L-iditol 2-dehydrogenase
MKVGRLGPAGTVRLEETAEPSPGPGEIVVEMAACGVCGTDLEKVRGNYKGQGILGHEPVGIVRSGDGPIGIGQRVFVHHHVPCGECAVCAKGDPTFCPQYARTNIDPGGFADRFRVPSENVRQGAVLPLESSLSWSLAALLEPAGCVLTALRRVGFHAGDSVFVVGLGPVGLLYARLAQALGAGWVGGAEISEFRRRAAERTGVVTFDPRDPAAVTRAVRDATKDVGVDISAVATGVPAALRLAEQLPRRGGTLNLFGLPEPGSRLETDLQKLYLSGVRIVPTYATTEPDVQEVHQLMVQEKVQLSDLVSHHFPLDRIGEAFEQATRTNETLKVLVTGPAFDPPRDPSAQNQRKQKGPKRASRAH